MRGRANMMKEIRWAFNVAAWKPTKEEWMHATSCISVEEKQRVHQFVFKNDAKLALVGRLLIRRSVNELLSIPWQEIVLGRTEKAKPFLVGRGDSISFNISHQGNYSIIAASRQYQVGVDVMKIDRPVNTTIPDFFSTMRRQFTAEEWQVIKSKPDERTQMASFYRHWCLKESYVKAVGTGLGTSTAEYMRFHLNVDPLPKKDIVTDSTLYLRGEKVDWKFHECLLDDDHIATVALIKKDSSCKDNPPPTEFVCLEFKNIMEKANQMFAHDQEDWTCFSNKKVKVVKPFTAIRNTPSDARSQSKEALKE